MGIDSGTTFLKLQIRPSTGSYDRGYNMPFNSGVVDVSKGFNSAIINLTKIVGATEITKGWKPLIMVSKSMLCKIASSFAMPMDYCIQNVL